MRSPFGIHLWLGRWRLDLRVPSEENEPAVSLTRDPAHEEPDAWPGASFKKNHDWLVARAGDPHYRGCWVVLRDGKLIGADPDRTRLQKRHRPGSGDLVAKMPM